MNIKQLLLTTDFSENSREAYPSAASLSRKFGARIHLVHFAGVYPAIISGTSSESFYEMLEQALDNEAATHPAFENVDIVAHLRRHRWTPEQLRSLETAQDIDVVVIGTQGRTGLQHFLLGSFAERVVRNSSVPVLVCRKSESQAAFEPKQVVVPYNFSEENEAVLSFITFLSAHYQCSFRFIYVYEPVPARSFPVLELIREFLTQTPKEPIEDRFAELTGGQLSDVDVTLETCQGVPAVEIVSRVQELQADLVLVGTPGELGSVSQNVTRQAPCSVLTVPNPKTVPSLA